MVLDDSGQYHPVSLSQTTAIPSDSTPYRQTSLFTGFAQWRPKKQASVYVPLNRYRARSVLYSTATMPCKPASHLKVPSTQCTAQVHMQPSAPFSSGWLWGPIIPSSHLHHPFALQTLAASGWPVAIFPSPRTKMYGITPDFLATSDRGLHSPSRGLLLGADWPPAWIRFFRCRIQAPKTPTSCIMRGSTVHLVFVSFFSCFFYFFAAQSPPSRCYSPCR